MTYRGRIYFLNDCGLRPGYSREGGKVVRCLRWGVGPKAARYTGEKFPQLVQPTERWQDAKVFAIGIPKEITDRWSFQRPFYYLVAMSEDAATSYLDKRFRKIILGSQKLAKRTLGVGMSKVATQSGTGRIAAGLAPTARVKRASNEYSDAKVWINGEEYGVRMESNLCYALSAVKGGSSAVDFAVRKAMNKTAGYINRMLGGSLDRRNRKLLTPFKDLVGKA